MKTLLAFLLLTSTALANFDRAVVFNKIDGLIVVGESEFIHDRLVPIWGMSLSFTHQAEPVFSDPRVGSPTLRIDEIAGLTYWSYLFRPDNVLGSERLFDRALPDPAMTRLALAIHASHGYMTTVCTKRLSKAFHLAVRCRR